jgi:hypothetical protein
MRKLQDSELFSLHMSASQKQELQNALNMKLNQNVGIIAPEQIETELLTLKRKSKSVGGILPEAIALFESFNGRIRLFNLGVSASGRSPVPAFMPFLVGNVRNKGLEGDKSSRGVSPAVLVNLHRIGGWSVDEKTYNGLNAGTDLFSALESGLIAYRMLVDNRAEKLLSNSIVLENLTGIYTTLFSKAVIKSATVYGNEFNTDAARFIIGKFFLVYVLKKQPSDTIDEIAHTTIKYRSSITGLRNYEENAKIDYSSMSRFLETFGMSFFNQVIDLGKFTLYWTSLYGEGMLFAVEYVPYLIHFLFSLVHGARLGEATRLINSQTELEKEGLIKLYNTVVAELR